MATTNLHERLKAEIITQMEAKKEVDIVKYNRVMQIFFDKNYFVELTIEEAVTIMYFLDIDFTLTNLINLFKD